MDMGLSVCPICHDILWYNLKTGKLECDEHGDVGLAILDQDMVVDLGPSPTAIVEEKKASDDGSGR